MRITTFKCDKCKKTVENEKCLKSMGIGFKDYNYSNGFRAEISFDLCSVCLEKIGLIKRVIKNEEIVAEPQDIRDKLYETMCDLVQELGLNGEYE